MGLQNIASGKHIISVNMTWKSVQRLT